MIKPSGKWRKKLANASLKKRVAFTYVFSSILPFLIIFISLFILMYNLILTEFKDGIKKVSEVNMLSIELRRERYEQVINRLAADDNIISALTAASDDPLQNFEHYRLVIEPVVNTTFLLYEGVTRVTFFVEEDKPQFGTIIMGKNNAPFDFDEVEVSGTNQWAYDNGTVYILKNHLDLYNARRIGIIYMEVEDQSLFGHLSELVSDGVSVAVSDTAFNSIAVYGNSGAADSVRLEEVSRAVAESQTAIRTGGDYAYQERLAGTPFVVTYFSGSGSFTLRALLIFTELFIIFAAVMLISFFALRLFFSSHIKKIYNLKGLMEKAEEGDFTPAEIEETNDEFGEIEQGYVKLIKKVNTLVNEVYAKNMALKESELDILQAQISPHFLYNSLSMINWKALMSDNAELSEIAYNLSTFYRTALSNSRKYIFVKEELDNVKAYINIELKMYDNNFEVFYEVDEALCDELIPKFIMQPLVENAIVHGLQPKEDNDKKLWIIVREEDGMLLLEVEDNGVGLSVAREDKPRSGYGIKNVNERIEMIYGESCGVEMLGEPGKNTTARIRLKKDLVLLRD